MLCVGVRVWGVCSNCCAPTCLPAPARTPARLQQEEGAAQAPASLHIRSALMAAVRRCMSWNNGAHAASTLQALPKDSEWLLLAPAAHDTQVHL